MTNEFKITKTGEYRTRGGRKAVVLCVDAPSDRPVIGYILDEENRFVGEFSWRLSGIRQLTFENGSDIVSQWIESEVVDTWTSISNDGSHVGVNNGDKKLLMDILRDDDRTLGYMHHRLTIFPTGNPTFEILEIVWK